MRQTLIGIGQAISPSDTKACMYYLIVSTHGCESVKRNRQQNLSEKLATNMEHKRFFQFLNEVNKLKNI